MILERQDRLKETLSFLQPHLKTKARVALILGSGLGDFVDRIKVERQIPFSEIPHFKPSSVKGHKGQWVFWGNTQFTPDRFTGPYSFL